MVVTGDWRIDEMAKYQPDERTLTYIPVPKEGDKSATWAGGLSLARILEPRGEQLGVHAVLRWV